MTMRRLAILLCVLGACSFSPSLESHDSGGPQAIDAPRVIDAAHADAPSPGSDAAIDARRTDAATPIDAPVSRDAREPDAGVPIDASPPPADASMDHCGGILEACCAPDETCETGLRCSRIFHVCVKPLL